MPKLPSLSGRELIRILKKAGFEAVSQKGSHVKLRKITSEDKITTVVPNHKKIDKGTLVEIIRQCKMSRDEFLELQE